MIYKATLFTAVLCVIVLSACTKKKEGVMVYQLQYTLPDSLQTYEAYLPKTSTVYFKDDSVATVQGTDQESTTMITHQPTNYMLCLLKSGVRRFEVQYNKDDQAKELPDMKMYDFIKGTATKKIAGYDVQQYIMKNKFNGDTTSTWFTHNVTVPPGFLTMVFNPELGVPVAFSTNQNGMVTKTTLKEIRYESVPVGIFNAPPGYMKLTPQQLREMPVEN
ncbi:hypothetical protein [Mucilaginibacter boryungensis]|uniref:GLPGLI family protein n=1 Tax=Mucilaginibacter boryungensis TaxID=768480 RepID=A0ABR9XNC7_9SPHI|nr:hypothetical protein [Mucilaginibacter boryungensis]MBE9668791.1 hypothetical protein [Mucilaginibacter boryungensis]